MSHLRRNIARMESESIIFSYLPAYRPARGGPSAAGGGALIAVSPRAAAVIRAQLDPDTGLLAPSARQVLVELDDREGRSTELGLLVRALTRRRAFVREAPTAGAHGAFAQ